MSHYDPPQCKDCRFHENGVCDVNPGVTRFVASHHCCVRFKFKLKAVPLSQYDTGRGD
jgi:hypothetical protein